MQNVYIPVVNIIQKSLLQKVNGVKLFEVTNNTNTGYAEIIQFADWSKFKQCGQDVFTHTHRIIA